MPTVISKNSGLYWEGWSSSKVEAYLEIILHTIACVIITILVVQYIYAFRCNNVAPKLEGKHTGMRSVSGPSTPTNTLNDKRVSYAISAKKRKIDHNKLFQRALLISIIISVINIFGNYYVSCLSVLIFNQRFNKGCFYRVLLTGLTMTIQRLIVYTFFLLRLKISFKNTKYDISNIKFGVLMAIMYIGGIVSQCLIGVNTYLNLGFRCNNAAHVIYLLGSAVWDVIWSVVITYLFVVRLKFANSLSNSKDDRFVKIIRKLTLLS